MDTSVIPDRLAALEEKLDAVSARLDFLLAWLHQQEARREMWDELRRDLAPVTSEALEHASRELDEVRAFVQPADLLRLAKRLLRDLPYLEALLEQVESLSQLGADLSPLGREALVAAMRALDDLEQRGYFAFARGSKRALDRLVASLGPEELQELAESMPGVVGALKALAHPEVMSLAQGLAAALRRPLPEEGGLLRLAWRLRRGPARRGLARALALLEALGAGPAQASPQQTVPTQ